MFIPGLGIRRQQGTALSSPLIPGLCGPWLRRLPIDGRIQEKQLESNPSHVSAEVQSSRALGNHRRERGYESGYSQGRLPGGEARVEDRLDFSAHHGWWKPHSTPEDQDK